MKEFELVSIPHAEHYVDHVFSCRKIKQANVKFNEFYSSAPVQKRSVVKFDACVTVLYYKSVRHTPI